MSAAADVLADDADVAGIGPRARPGAGRRLPPDRLALGASPRPARLGRQRWRRRHHSPLWPCAHDRTAARRLADEPPPLARIDRIERTPSRPSPADAAFHIADSAATGARTGVVPDAATCRNAAPKCSTRRSAATPLSVRQLRPLRPAAVDRRGDPLRPPRHHDAPVRVLRRLRRRIRRRPTTAASMLSRSPAPPAARAPGWSAATARRSALDAIDGAASLLMRGEILAIKGLGGFQLACDATDAAAVARLRARKRRPRKPLALMVRDLEVARAWGDITEQEAALLGSAAAPIMLVSPRAGGRRAADAIAPGVGTLGVMLPNTPLHHLLLTDRPAISAYQRQSLRRAAMHRQRRSPRDARRHRRLFPDARPRHRAARRQLRRADHRGQAAPAAARARLRPGADRPAGGFRRCAADPGDGRRAQGDVLPVRDGEAILSHHMGDLEDARTFADYRADRRLSAIVPTRAGNYRRRSASGLPLDHTRA